MFISGDTGASYENTFPQKHSGLGLIKKWTPLAIISNTDCQTILILLENDMTTRILYADICVKLEIMKTEVNVC